MTTTTVTQVNIATQKADIGAQYTALVNSLGSEVPDVTSFLMANTTYAKDDLVARFRAFLAAIDATRSAQTTLRISVARERDLCKQVAPLRAQLKAYLSLRFGKNSPEMQKFGFTQAKVPKTPVASKAEGIAKGQGHSRRTRHRGQEAEEPDRGAGGDSARCRDGSGRRSDRAGGLAGCARDDHDGQDRFMTRR